MISKLVAKLTRRNTLPEQLSYEDARAVLEEKDTQTRRELAAHPDARPEMLFYLAGDDSAEVRRYAAGNAHTPVQANRLLAEDADDEVRCELARKIGKLLPDLDETEQARLREQTIEVMKVLAEDQLPRIRQIVAEEIKSADNIPKDMVLRLAQDVEQTVCAPILEYSPLLNVDDLREIIATTKVKGALTAIAKRTDLPAEVSDDIAGTLDVPAVAALLANPSAQIREETLDAIIDHAEAIQDWHAPIALRPNLSIRAVRRISSFVASSLIERMTENNDLPTEVADELRARVRERISSQEFGPADDEKEIRRQAKQLFSRGEITDEYIVSLVEKGRESLVMELLGLMTKISPAIVRHIVEIRHPHGVTALAWKAGLSMRTAMTLQTDLARISPSRRLNARNGVDYPLSAEEMNTQLGYFLDQPPAA